MSNNWENAFDSDSSDDEDPKIDYYKILGVSKKSTKDQIKKCYRQKARKLHPDKHPQEIEKYKKLFQELCEAYSVLSDEKKRQVYDKFGARGLQNRNFFIPKNKNDLDMLFKMAFEDDDSDKDGDEDKYDKNNKNKCATIHIQKKISFSDVTFGNTVVISFEKRVVCTSCKNNSLQCPQCKGEGKVKGFLPSFGQDNKKVCLDCNKGYTKDHCTTCEGSSRGCSVCGYSGVILKECKKCNGSGKIKDGWSYVSRRKTNCTLCDGTGRYCKWCQDKKYIKITCNIPTCVKKVKNNQKQVFKGLGHEKENCNNGDVIVTYLIR